MDPVLPLKITPGSHIGPDRAENPENLKKIRILTSILDSFWKQYWVRIAVSFYTCFKRVLKNPLERFSEGFLRVWEAFGAQYMQLLGHL